MWRRLESLRERTDEWLAPWDETGILRELVTGTRHPGGSLEFLGLLGLIHLLTVSGIHLYALARLCDWAMKRFAVWNEWLPLAWVKLVSHLGTILVWLTAWGLAGARAGMLRPWLVIGSRSAAARAGLRMREWAPLALALAMDTAVGAWRGDLGTSGRWIYALACAGGLMARRSPWAALGSWLLVALLQAWRTGTIALATPLLSAITVPIFAGMIYPALLVACALQGCGLATPALAIAQVCGTATSALTSLLTGAVMQGELLWIVDRLVLAGGLLAGSAALFATPKQRIALLAAMIGIRLGCISVASALSPEATPLAMQVEQLDVGQGDAALVTNQPTWASELRFGMIDSGSERALSDRAWLELLSRRGARRLDWIALTHLDEDHSGGVKRLGRLVPIGCVATAREQIESPRGQRYKQELEHLGIRLTDWSGECVPFPRLAPPHGSGDSKANAYMGAVLIPLEGRGFYLSAGDADAQDEPRIGAWATRLASELPWQAVRILKISHHGSKTSSNPRFIETVRPTEAWISVGAGNTYGHPAVSVIEELRRMNIPVRRTDEEGSLKPRL